MKLSVDTLTLHKKFGDEKMIRMMKKAGFDAIDYAYCFLNEGDDALGDHYVEYAHQVKAWLDENQMTCCQAHAPIKMKYGCAFDEMEEAYRLTIRSIEAAAILGAESIVVHSMIVPEGIDGFAYNLAYYRSLIPYCEKYGMHVSVENLGKKNMGRFHTPQMLYSLLEKLDSPWFGICVDVGHAAIIGPDPELLIRGLDNRVLKCLHIHDNDCEHDNHALPYTGNLNWSEITNALKEIDYQGYFSLELPTYFAKFEDETIYDALVFAEKIGRHLVNKIEQ